MGGKGGIGPAPAYGPGREAKDGRPDPEVTEIPARRKFSPECKLRIFGEADACKDPGEIGALLKARGSEFLPSHPLEEEGAVPKPGLAPRRSAPV